jgi:hypothetical protein
MESVQADRWHNRLWSAEKQKAASRVKSGLTEIRLPVLAPNPLVSV